MAEISYTIIIPHYNIPDLLMRCLKSIPVREDIQVIVIDDCSPNADAYLGRFPELSRPYLEYYSTPQGGSAGRARNIGLDHAKGKWIICMDADDFFVDNMEEILLESKDKEEDILFYNYRNVFSSDLTKEASRNHYNHYFTLYKEDCNESPFRYCFDPIWGKIIKKSLIDKYHLRCDETRYGNDVGFSYKCGALAKKIVIIDKELFVITTREGSLDSAKIYGNKRSVNEFQSRMTSLLNIAVFNNEYKIKNRFFTYAVFSIEFFKSWPKEFLKFYYSSIIPNYFRQSCIIFLYMFCYYTGIIKGMSYVRHFKVAKTSN